MHTSGLACVLEVRGRRGLKERTQGCPSTGHLGLTNRLPTFMEQHLLYISITELLTTNRPVMTLDRSGCVRTACGLPDARRSACFLGGGSQQSPGGPVVWVSAEIADLSSVTAGRPGCVTSDSKCSSVLVKQSSTLLENIPLIMILYLHSWWFFFNVVREKKT